MAKFEDFVKKAEKRSQSYPDYKLELEGEVYAIPYPDAIQALDLTTLDDNQIFDQLRVLFTYNSKALSALIRELRGEDAAVIQVIVEDMFDFWNKNGAPLGDTKTSKK